MKEGLNKFGYDDRKGFSPCSRDPLRLTGTRLSSGHVLLMDASRGRFLICRVYDEEGEAKIHLRLRPDEESRFAYFLRPKPELSWTKGHAKRIRFKERKQRHGIPGRSKPPCRPKPEEVSQLREYGERNCVNERR